MQEDLGQDSPHDPVVAALATIAARLRADELTAEAEALVRKIDERTYYVACIGQFKRGKSTLINALVGDPVLPTGVAPVTSVVTMVRFGARRQARVRMGQGGWLDWAPERLGELVSEEGNPGNRRGVRAVEVMTPSALLRSGMCLVDTPGLGSVIEANTRATEAFVPHIDAALVVIGADPPVAGDELRLIEEVARRVRRMIFVLNKADRLPRGEVDQAVGFSARVLAERLRRPVGGLLELSAREAIERGPTRDWDRLVETLEQLAEESGADLLEESRTRALAYLAARLTSDLDERLAALERPEAASRERRDRLRLAIAEAEQALGDLGPLFTAEEERLGRALSREREEFFARALPPAARELSAELKLTSAGRPHLRRRAVELAMALAERSLQRWKTERGPEVEALYRRAAARFVEIAAALETRLMGETELHLPSAMEMAPRLDERAQYHFTELWTSVPDSAGRRLLDAIGPRQRRMLAIERDAREYLSRLFEVNSARVRNDFAQRVRKSRLTLEDTIRRRLRAVLASTDRAIHEADQARAQGAAALAERTGELRRFRAEVERLMSEATIQVKLQGRPST